MWRGATGASGPVALSTDGDAVPRLATGDSTRATGTSPKPDETMTGDAISPWTAAVTMLVAASVAAAGVPGGVAAEAMTGPRGSPSTMRAEVPATAVTVGVVLRNTSPGVVSPGVARRAAAYDPHCGGVLPLLRGVSGPRTAGASRPMVPLGDGVSGGDGDGDGGDDGDTGLAPAVVVVVVVVVVVMADDAATPTSRRVVRPLEWEVPKCSFAALIGYLPVPTKSHPEHPHSSFARGWRSLRCLASPP